MTDLKRCPFCGSKAVLKDCRTVWTVQCTNIACHAIILGERAPEPDGSESYEYWTKIEQTAITRWNTRAPDLDCREKGIILNTKELDENHNHENNV